MSLRTRLSRRKSLLRAAELALPGNRQVGFLSLWRLLPFPSLQERSESASSRSRDAPEFSDDSWEDRDWETRTHQHYGVPSYSGA